MSSINLWASGRRVAHALGDIGADSPSLRLIYADEHERVLMTLHEAGVDVERETEVSVSRRSQVVFAPDCSVAMARQRRARRPILLGVTAPTQW